MEVAEASFMTVMFLMSLGFIPMMARLDDGIPSMMYSGVELAPREPTPWMVIETELSPATPDDERTDRPATCPCRASRAEDEGAFFRISDLTVATDPTREPSFLAEP